MAAILAEFPAQKNVASINSPLFSLFTVHSADPIQDGGEERPRSQINRLAGPPPVTEAVPVPILPPPCAMSAPAPVVMSELGALRRKTRTKKHMEQAEAAVPSSESPRPPSTPEPKPGPLIQVAPETLTLTAAAMRRGKGSKRKNQEVAPAASPLVEEPVWKEEQKRKRKKHGEEAPATPLLSTAAVPQILEVESKVVEEGAIAKKQQLRRAVEQEQLSHLPVPVDVHSQLGEEAVDGGANRVHRSKGMSRNKQHPLPQGFFPPVANPNFFAQDPKYSSPFGAFFDQFCYKPDRQQNRNRNDPPLPNTPYRAARPSPRGHPSSGSSLLSADEACKAVKKTILNTKQRCSASTSTSGSQDVKAKQKEKPKKMARVKKQRKPSPVLSAAEKRSDKYRRLPLDQLVTPLRSPHKLLQEDHASDPWKVIVICILLNLTHGTQVKKIVKGFFECYPDARAAYTADQEEMEEYIKPLGLNHVKTSRIQNFSKAYVGEEWTHITKLCGVGKYAADAYAIFCAGKATEVDPKDHKLVDYWKYVCSELPIN